MCRHIRLQLLCVGSWRGFPSGKLLGSVEVIGEILRVRMSDFPASRQAGISLVFLHQLSYPYNKASFWICNNAGIITIVKLKVMAKLTILGYL